MERRLRRSGLLSLIEEVDQDPWTCSEKHPLFNAEVILKFIKTFKGPEADDPTVASTVVTFHEKMICSCSCQRPQQAVGAQPNLLSRAECFHVMWFSARKVAMLLGVVNGG